MEIDKAYARQRLATIRSPVTIDSSEHDVRIRTQNDYHGTKIAHNMATKLKKVTFARKLEEAINELIATYTKALFDYDHSATQKLGTSTIPFMTNGKSVLLKICITNLCYILRGLYLNIN